MIRAILFMFFSEKWPIYPEAIDDIYANKLNEPKQLSIDNKNRLLYVGTRSGEVIVFKIFYKAKTMVYSLCRQVFDNVKQLNIIS